MKVLKELLAKEVRNLPRRIMSSGGQNYSYIKLDDVLAILGQDIDGNPEPESKRPIRHCCVCLSEQFHTPSGWTCKNGHGGADSEEVPKSSSHDSPHFGITLSAIHDKELKRMGL